MGLIVPPYEAQAQWAESRVESQRDSLRRGLLGDVKPYSVGERYPPLFWEFELGIKKAATIRKALRAGTYEGNTAAGNTVFLRNKPYRPTHEDYLQCLADFYDSLGMMDVYLETMAEMPMPALNPAARNGHTSIVANSDIGKSELMKALVMDDIQRGAGILIIDPHKSFGREVAQWPEVADTGRLIYVGPPIEGHSARFNPLDVRGSLHEKEKAAHGFLDTLKDIMPEAPFSSFMQTMAIQCLRLAMEYQGSTWITLHEMLLPSQIHLWAKRGLKHPSANVVRFFQHDFLGDDKKQTRDAVRSRISHLIMPDFITDTFCGPSTFDLKAELEAGKVVVFDIERLTGPALNATAKMLLGSVASIARRRKGAARPIHVYVDEGQTIIGDSTGDIFRETRKMGVFLTLAAQKTHPQLMQPAVRIAGGNQWNHALAGTPLAKSKEDKNTTQGVFWVNWANQMPPFKVTVRKDLARGTRSVSPARWREVMAAQRAAYYRPPPVAAGAPATDAGGEALPARKRRKPD